MALSLTFKHRFTKLKDNVQSPLCPNPFFIVLSLIYMQPMCTI